MPVDNNYSFRCDTDLRRQVMERAKAEGLTMTDVLVAAMIAYRDGRLHITRSIGYTMAVDQ